MKKALSMLLVIVMVLSLMPMTVLAASNPTIYFETDFTTELAVGDTFTVTAHLKDNERFDALTLTLKWNENVVKFNGFAANNRGIPTSEVFNAGAGYSSANINQNTGKIMGVDLTGYGYDNNGMLFIANFEIVNEGALGLGLKTDDPTVFEMVDNNGVDQAPILDLSALQNLTVGGKAVGPEMPDDAPFTAITTDAGPIVAIEEADQVNGVPYYIVSIPADAETAYVTAPDQVLMEDFITKEVMATAYASDLSFSSDPEYISFNYEDTADGPKVEIPLYWEDALGMQGPVDLCFVADENKEVTHAFGIEAEGYACLGWISFVYDDGLEEYNITIDENMVGGTIYACDEDGNEISKAKAGETVFVEVEADGGYTTTGAYYINGQIANDFMFVMPEEDVVLTATFQKQHTHVYDKEVAADKYLKDAATCKSGAVYYKSCECGNSATTAETFVSGETVACVYENGVCKWCGEAAKEPILSFTAGGQTLEAVTAEDYCSEFEVTAQKLTVTVPAGVNIVTINCAASMCAYIDHVSSDLSPSGNSAEIDLTQDLTFVCVPVTLDDGSDAYYHVYFEQEAGDVDPEPEDPAVTPGYSFATSADVSTVNGGNAVVKVKITGHSDPNVTSYNAYDLTLTFDSDKLEYQGYDGAVKSDNGSVTVEGNTIRIVGCGADKGFGTEIAALTFKTKGEGQANITIDKVQVSDKNESVKEDAPEATPKHDEDDTTADETPDVSVIVVPYSVSKPSFITGNDKVLHGETYTFSYTDTDNYTYSELKVTVGGTEVTPSEADGVYTIENVTGAIVIEAIKTANSYNVTKPENVTGAETATYGTDYVFTVTPTEGKEIESVTVTVNGNAYSCTINQEGAYEIKGEDISGVITITVTEKDKEVPVVKYTNITFSGITAEEIEGGSQTVQAEAGKPYTFKLNKVVGFTYTVKLGEEVLTANEDGSYTIPAAKMIEGNLTVTIEKAENINVDVTEYIKLDGQSMFLITAKSAVEGSVSVLKYGDDVMYTSAKYNAYSWLVISAESAEAVKVAAETAITIAEAGSIAPAVAYGYDVNGTSKVDVNDAQLVYDMYNASYDAFTENLTVKKFLEADTDGSKNLGTQDVAVIINYIVSQQTNVNN